LNVLRRKAETFEKTNAASPAIPAARDIANRARALVDLLQPAHLQIKLPEGYIQATEWRASGI
jgi:hypothetical protein